MTDRTAGQQRQAKHREHAQNGCERNRRTDVVTVRTDYRSCRRNRRIAANRIATGNQDRDFLRQAKRTADAITVNRRWGHPVSDIGHNALNAIKKGQSRWGHHRRRSGPHPNANSFIRRKELPALLQGAQFGADSQSANYRNHCPAITETRTLIIERALSSSSARNANVIFLPMLATYSPSFERL